MTSKQHFLSMIALAMTIFSIGMTTTLLSAAYAQEQKFTASLSGDQEVPGWAWIKPMEESVWYKIWFFLLSPYLVSAIVLELQ